MPQISVIMAAYNSTRTIEKAIESVQSQTFQDFEIVVADDGSADGTHELVDTLAAKDPRIKSLQLPANKGAGAARNLAIAHAIGTWVTLLDADDWYEPNRLAVLLRAARDFRADVVGDNLRIFDHAVQRVVERTMFGHPGRVMPLTPEIFFARDNPLRRHAMGYLQPLIRRSFLVDHHIRYDEDHRAGEDFIFLAEILLQGARAVLVPEAGYVYMHRISPTTRRRSGESRSEAGHRLIVKGCDELLAKYETAMTPRARRALKRRRWIFENRVRCEDMLDALREGRYLAAFRVLAVWPFILVLIANTIGKMLLARLRYFSWRLGFRRWSA